MNWFCIILIILILGLGIYAMLDFLGVYPKFEIKYEDVDENEQKEK